MALLNSGKYALVTGGNRGIGLEVCRQLVSAGKPVILTARSEHASQEVAKQLASQARAPVKALPLDVTSAASIDSFVAAVKEGYDQQVDVLINNAGVLFRDRWDQEEFDATLATNFTAPVRLTEALRPLLPKGAMVVMVSSGLGKLACLTEPYRKAVTGASSMAQLASSVAFRADRGIGGSDTPSYSISKAMLNRAVQFMSADEKYVEKRIAVVSICPGWCRTDMGSNAADRSAEQGAQSVVWPLSQSYESVNGGFFRDGGAMAWD